MIGVATGAMDQKGLMQSLDKYRGKEWVEGKKQFCFCLLVLECHVGFLSNICEVCWKCEEMPVKDMKVIWNIYKVYIYILFPKST